MVEDGEDCHGFKTTNLNNLSLTTRDEQSVILLPCLLKGEGLSKKQYYIFFSRHKNLALS